MRLDTPRTPGLRPRLLAVLMSSALCPAMAAETAPAKTDDTITVTATQESDFTPGGDQLVPAYLDGQVANGGRLGILGEQDARNVPFNVISYTSKMLRDKQAQTLSDVMANDASVQNVAGYGNFGESFRIRGFDLTSDDIAYGGLYGVLPRQVISMELAERVEVIKGSTAFLNGVPPGGSGVGGSINLEPKHADSEPLNRLSVDYSSDSRVGGAIDAGRRFGDNDQYGVRVNVLHREGETAIDDEKSRMTLATVGLDYKGDRFRSSLDAGWEKSTMHNGRIGVGIGQATEAPNVPDNRTNYSQPWVYSDMASRFAMWRGEYDLTPDWTVYSAFGGSHTDERGAYSSPKLVDNAGNATMSRLSTRYKADTFSGMMGVRGKFETGFVKHNVNLGYSGVYRKARSAWTMSGAYDTNIYDPVSIPNPETLYTGGDMNHPAVTARTRSTGLSVSDTLSVLDDRLLLTLGARRQDVMVRNYSATGVEESGAAFDAMKVTPVYGLVVKPWEEVSFYANHIESLQPGSTAPTTAINSGQVSGIVTAKQNEVGVKLDYGRIGGSLALFEIKQPVGMMDSNSYYSLYGEQRNRGVELNVFGELVYGVRVMGSAVFIDPELTKTKDGANNGNDAVGTPRWQWRLGGEWDIPGVENLTATGTLYRTGGQYANADNSVKLNGWTRLDLGMRYSMKVNDQKVVWRAGVENVTNEKYWASVDNSGTYIVQGEPRTVKVSMSVDF
jgi:iron complex outermembrane receptor protein